MPTLTLDLSWFSSTYERLAAMPMPELWWTVLIYGGWIPLVFMIWEIIKMNWLNSRQAIFAKKLSFVLLSINVPRANEQTPKAVEHIFTHLAGAARRFDFRAKWWRGEFALPFSFELASIDGYTQFVVRTPTALRDLIEAAVFSQYPEAEITEIADYAQAVPGTFPHPEYDCWGGEFCLAKDDAYPIRTWQEFEHTLSQEFKDPLSSMLESLSRLKKGEQAWIQIIVWPGDQDWTKKAAGVVGKMMGKEIKKPKPAHLQALHATTEIAEGLAREFVQQIVTMGTPMVEKKPEAKDVTKLSPGERKTLEAIEEKMSKIGFRCKMRMIYVARRDVYRAGPVSAMVRGALGLYGSQSGNSFRPFMAVSPRSDYFWRAWSADKKKNAIMANYRGRSGLGGPSFVLNVEELASVWHFPQNLVKAPMIKKVESKKVEPPFQLPLA